MSLFAEKGKKSTVQPLFETIEHRFGVDEIAYRWPKENLTKGSVLFVNPGQEAILIAEGQISATFTNGRYELNTDNIPILQKFQNVPFGGSAAYRCSVIFINKDKEVQIRWGTQAPIKLRDPESKRLIEANGRGEYSVRINDAGVFLQKALGQLNSFQAEDIADYLFSKTIETVTSKISVALQQKKIPLIEIASHYTELSDEMYNQIVNDGIFERYGFRMNIFSIKDISMPDKDWKELQDYDNKYLEKIREVDSLRYRGEIYDKELSHDVLKAAAENTGSGTMMNMGMGLGVGLGIGSGFGGAMNTMAAGMVVPGAAASSPQTVLCPTCRKPTSSSAKFCQFCGGKIQEERLRICPKCQATNEDGAMFCSHCGGQLTTPQQKECPFCRTWNDGDAKFCKGCGKSTEPSKVVCPECGCENETDASFCHNCGKKLRGEEA